ncbi:serine/threonine-protein kinase, partial [Singulisphaera rosea]
MLEDFRLDGYEIGDALGEGGMGLVYRARQVALNRSVALKIIRGDPTRLVSRFQIEAEAVARLQHPNIVQIYEVGWKDGRPYLALELVDGGSLEEKLAGRPQPAREAAELVRTLSNAVDYAHRRGIIHRDLKPSNILLTAGGVPKIADFGVAKRLELNDHETRDGDLIGTPCYMAPEQASGSGEQIGPATDVYSLGVILYETLTGRAPLQAPTAIETLILVNVQEPVPPRRLQPRIPADLERITLKCLEKEPGRRYANALDLAEDLGRFLNNEPILARQIPWYERAWRWARRRPALASALGAAAIG